MSALPSVHRADRAVVGADAAGELYQQYGSRIFAFCLSRLGNREEAEDAAQTTFLNAFRSLHDGLVPRFELAWLFRIADNVCRDRHKSAWRRGRVEATRDLQELQDVVSAPERRSDGLIRLQTALAGLPERQRRAILLREWQGLSYREIARELGLTQAAVETLIFRARRSLARGLEAPQAPPRRARAAFDAGWLLGLVKSLFASGGAAQVGASVAAVAGAGLLVAAPLQDRSRQARTERKDVRTPAAQQRETSIRHTQNGPIASLRKRARGVAEQKRGSAASKREGQGATVSRATGIAAVPSGKRGESTRPAPAPAPPTSAAERPAPAAETPASTPGTPPAPAPSPPPALPASLPSLPSVPELPPVLPETPLEPPAVPPPPDLPVDAPDLAEVPRLPDLP